MSLFNSLEQRHSHGINSEPGQQIGSVLNPPMGLWVRSTQNETGV